MPSSWIEIDLAALRHNFDQARQRLPAETRIVGVVKSDAYGHGMVPVARELVACGAGFLAVSKFWEAQELRANGLSVPVLVLLGVEGGDMEEAVRQSVRPVIYRLDHARVLSRTAAKLGMRAPFHLKVDTGMGRLGVPWDRLGPFLDELLALEAIEMEGIMSHFSVADEGDKSFSHLQMERFRQALELLSRKGVSAPYVHMANSAGLLDLPAAHFQLVRPGIMLYGSPPSSELHHPPDLLPVMCFKSKVIQLKELPIGRFVGYGRTFVTVRPSRIVTIPVGYDDGYDRLLSNHAQLLIRGMRAPVVGRVSMNMITADVSHLPQVQEDEEVVLLGAQGDDRITAEELAGICGTISYEIYCNIGKNPFKYFFNASAEPE